jgi:hypothetical protein
MLILSRKTQSLLTPKNKVLATGDQRICLGGVRRQAKGRSQMLDCEAHLLSRLMRAASSGGIPSESKNC